MRKGQSHSEETKAKISAAKAGVKFTAEHSVAISTALQGKKKSAAHRKAIAEGVRLAHAQKLATIVSTGHSVSDQPSESVA